MWCHSWSLICICLIPNFDCIPIYTWFKFWVAYLYMIPVLIIYMQYNLCSYTAHFHAWTPRSLPLLLLFWSDHSLFFFSFCYCFVHIYDQPISLHEHFVFCLLYFCDIRGIWSAPYPYVNALLLIDMATVNPSEFVSRLPIVSTICVLLCHDQYACGYLFSYSISCRLYI